MSFDRPDFHVITGGPGSGKTSIIRALQERGYRCVDEVGRQIIRAQLMIGGNALHSGDRELFRELMLSHAMSDFLETSEDGGPVFFDRGIPGLIGYCRLSGMPVPDHLRKAASQFRYGSTVFVTPPWPEIYRNDEERKQDFAEAIETYTTVVAAYGESGYRPLELPKASVADRVAFILKEVAASGV